MKEEDKNKIDHNDGDIFLITQTLFYRRCDIDSV